MGFAYQGLKSLAKTVRPPGESTQPYAPITIGSAGGDITDEMAERAGLQSLKGLVVRRDRQRQCTWRFPISARGVRAIVVFVVLMGLFYGFVHTPANETTAFRSYLALIARVVGGILSLFGYQSSVTDTVIHTPQFSLEIVRGCDAIEPAATYIAAVLASPVGVWPRLPGILIGTAAIMLVNLVRIVSLYFVGVYYPSAFIMIHEGVWQAAFVVLAIVFWAVWVQWATRGTRERPNAQPQEESA